jgi:hypothetical protein
MVDLEVLGLREELRDAIEDLSLNRKHCPNCGGIVLELIMYKDIEYLFTCTKITRGKKILDHTGAPQK